MKHVVIQFRYNLNPNVLNLPGDSFDTHGEFTYVGCNGEIIAMIRTDIIDYICISEKKE